MTRRYISFICFIALVCSPVWATEFRTGRDVSISSDEVINDDLFAAANSVLIAGRVEGDVFAAGQTVRITGPVAGSVMAAGGYVEVADEVSGSVRAAGRNVRLAGTVGRNGTVAGESVVLAETLRVGRDLHAAGNTVDLDGSVDRNASIAATAATVRGMVGEKLYLEGNELSLSPTARVGGDLSYRSSNQLEIGEGAAIGGQTQQLAPRQPEDAAPKRVSAVRVVILLLMAFVFGAVGLAVAPRFFGAAADAVGHRPWRNLLLGFLTLFLGPFAVLVVCVTVVGIPVGVLGLIAWLVALAFAGVPVGTFLGRRLLQLVGNAKPSAYLGLLIGLVILALVALVPIIGVIVKAATILLGLGVYARAAKGVLAEMRAQPA